MPTKRELREALEEKETEQEQTQQLSVEEIQKEVEKTETGNDYASLDVPNFTQLADSVRKNVENIVESDGTDDGYEVEDTAMDKPLKIMIGCVVAVVLVVIAVVTVNLINTEPSTSKNTGDAIATVTPATFEEDEEEPTATPKTSNNSLDYYYAQR